MDPATVTLFLAGAEVVKRLAPLVQDMINKGEISVERQAEVNKAFEDLRNKKFDGEAWKVS